MRTPGVVAALRSIALAPDDVIGGIDFAVAVEVAGLRDDQGGGVEQKGAGNFAQALAVIVPAPARDQAGVVHVVGGVERPLGAFGGVVGVEPRVEVDHVSVQAGRAGVEKSVSSKR